MSEVRDGYTCPDCGKTFIGMGYHDCDAKKSPTNTGVLTALEIRNVKKAEKGK